MSRSRSTRVKPASRRNSSEPVSGELHGPTTPFRVLISSLAHQYGRAVISRVPASVPSLIHSVGSTAFVRRFSAANSTRPSPSEKKSSGSSRSSPICLTPSGPFVWSAAPPSRDVPADQNRRSPLRAISA